MTRISPCLLVALAICIGTGVTAAQSTSSTADATTTTTAPVAYVYVSSGQYGSTTGRIYGYAASRYGRLTPVPGSPLITSLVGPLALNGKWLFGAADLGGTNETGQFAIDSYRIAANGSIRHQDTYYGTAPNSEQPDNLFLDHTGASLYSGMSISDEDSGYGSFRIDQTNGKIILLNYIDTGALEGDVLTFIGNNKFAYGASSYFRDCPDIFGFARASGGELSSLGINPRPPRVPNEGYCPIATAADPTSHVVISMGLTPDGLSIVSYQLAVYTADKYGNLSTASTYKNMPVSKVETDQLAMSTGGAFLAAAGSNFSSTQYDGVQLFRMHGANPLTVFSGVLLPGVAVQQLFWDKYDHLYVLGASKLYVFTVTQSGVKQAPGSPYNIPSPQGLIVLPK